MWPSLLRPLVPLSPLVLPGVSGNVEPASTLLEGSGLDGGSEPSLWSCPPIHAGKCLLEPPTGDREMLFVELRLAAVLDRLMEVHEFHCDLEGYRAIKNHGKI